MPIYEYRCVECGHDFQRLQKIGAGTEGVTCPRCDSHEVERQISSFAASCADASSSSGST